MIKVNRDREAVPGSLRGRRGPAKAEFNAAIAFFEDKGILRKDRVGMPFLKGKVSGFSAYKNGDVKLALVRLFHGKCAYCESSWSAVMPMDVEHWRPKAGVERIGADGSRESVAGHPGYYWLAADWGNLLPSCRDCNSPRSQTNRERGVVGLFGKGNLFPLRAGSNHAFQRGEEEAEQPLLLHPCKDDPAEHLLFSAEADGIVLPRKRRGGEPSEMAQASIYVYALNRAGLVQERLAVLRQIERRLLSVRHLVAALARAERTSAADAMDVEDLLSHELSSLARFRRPQSPYALMARQVIDDFMNQMLDIDSE